jgi:hypothetical protein
MNDHIETPDTDDVEGHVLFANDGQVPGAPARLRVAIDGPDYGADDDVEGHVLDLDVERRR